MHDAPAIAAQSRRYPCFLPGRGKKIFSASRIVPPSPTARAAQRRAIAPVRTLVYVRSQQQSAALTSPIQWSRGALVGPGLNRAPTRFFRLKMSRSGRHEPLSAGSFALSGPSQPAFIYAVLNETFIPFTSPSASLLALRQAENGDLDADPFSRRATSARCIHCQPVVKGCGGAQH